ncbi:protein of unknown function DUF3067 containing protein [Nitzschia inconspicua]|uniref:Uncharacterized protein n=1 Tax=Nitzschia inconspicua TaxID=303405 RepID=A0A9K3PLY1_9STRA|nr:protein of unknown function DUF3067 containing protein [Nitzschia inconspicua]
MPRISSRFTVAAVVVVYGSLLIVLGTWTYSEGFLLTHHHSAATTTTTRARRTLSPRVLLLRTETRRNNWLVDLWEEVIEFCTYGPGERKMLKAKRKAAAIKNTNNDNNTSLASFQQAKKKIGVAENNSSIDKNIGNDDDSSVSLQAFQSAVVKAGNDNNVDDIGFDGYALRDLLIAKWGVPLDIDFQRGYTQQTVYCTILPVAFGSSKCRHANEMEYLMHLQAVVETLHEYNNLEEFCDFVSKTSRRPKPGVESVPFRLELSPQQLQKVLGGEYEK